MKKVNLTIIATIIATFAISMFAFQPTKIEVNNNALPSATPTKAKKPSKLIQKPKTTAKHFGADLIEGSNIRRKKPNRRKFDHIGNFNKAQTTSIKHKPAAKH